MIAPIVFSNSSGTSFHRAGIIITYRWKQVLLWSSGKIIGQHVAVRKYDRWLRSDFDDQGEWIIVSFTSTHNLSNCSGRVRVWTIFYPGGNIIKTQTQNPQAIHFLRELEAFDCSRSDGVFTYNTLTSPLAMFRWLPLPGRRFECLVHKYQVRQIVERFGFLHPHALSVGAVLEAVKLPRRRIAPGMVCWLDTA